jgi:hypothetical protein
MITIRTAFWFQAIPADHVRVGISRGSPRRFPAGYRLYRRLAPGPWFRSASPAEYLRLYGAQLDALDPAAVVDQLEALTGGRPAALCCYERAEEIAAGETFCHRNLVGTWLERHLPMTVEEIGAGDDWDAFAFFKKQGIAA